MYSSPVRYPLVSTRLHSSTHSSVVLDPIMTEWYDFFDAKSTKSLSFFPVAEAYGLIYHRPSGENSNFVVILRSL